MRKVAIQRAVVTGAGGFIGKHLVRCLERAKVSVVGIDRAGAGVEHVDVGATGALDPFLDSGTALFHLAGSANVQRSVHEPVADFHENVATTIEVLDAMRRAGARMIIFPSTGSVYDPQQPGPYSEHSLTRPSSPYGAAKLACEAYCQAYAQSYGVDVRIARLFSVYGPGMRRFAIHDFYQRLKQSPEKLTLRGNGGQTRDYLFIDDAVRALLLIAANGASGEIYNVASGCPLTLIDVATAVAHAMGLHGCTIEPDNAVIASEVYNMDAEVSKGLELGFSTSVKFDDGLRTTIDWFRSVEA